MAGYIVVAMLAGTLIGFGICAILAQNAITRARQDGWDAHVAHIRRQRKDAGMLAARTRKANGS